MATLSTSTTGTAEQLSKPKYRNWLALGHALTTVLCQGLRPFVTREIKTLYENVIKLAAGRPCTCIHVPRRRPNEFHDMRTCALANILECHHNGKKPNWKQSDPAKWMDPILGPWEMAKVFLPDLGGHADIKSADDMDITGILNLMYWCSHFTIPQHLIQLVRETRNNKWVHVPKLELSDADKTDAFDAIENLLKDPKLASDPDTQKALKEIANLKSVTDLHSMEAQILADFKEVINKEILYLTQESERNKEQVSQLKQQQLALEKAVEDLGQRNKLLEQLQNKEILNLSLESAKNKEQVSQLKHQQVILEKAVEDLGQRNKLLKQFHVVWVWQLLVYAFGGLIRSLTRFRRGILLLFLFWNFCSILDDDTLIKEECSTHVYSGSSELKYFDFSDFINSSRAEFIGRQWLYRELESVLEHTNNRGVLLTGNPGSGKSAFLSSLLCSNISSPIIHNRILGYHFCMHLNKWTKSGANFVENLANMITWRIIEYRQVLLTDLFVRRVLNKDCPQDPEWCFQQAILKPLKQLQQQRIEPWYVVIDALDECADAKAEILNILKSQVRLFPKWLKLIVSSRNVSSIVGSLDELQGIDLRPDDRRNLEDIDTYISLKVFPLKESIVRRIKTALAITDNDTPTQKIVSSLAEKGQGNFLFVKVVLDLWLSSTDTLTWDTFPKTLGSSYQLYFERKYGTSESFQSLRQIFEVLVAAFTPLNMSEMHSLLSLDNPTLDLEYELMPKLDQVSSFLYGSGDGLIRIYHTSLSEWLTSEANKGRFYYIKKQNGHNRLARYYLKNAVKNNSPLKPEEAFHLASHIVKGGLDDSMVEQFLSLPSCHINTTDPVTGTTALHHSSGCLNAEVTNLLLHHFSNIDCLDKDQRTPSFIAATSGHLSNFKVLFERGANLNHTVGNQDVKILSNSEDPVSECKRKLCGYSLLHAAAQEGNIEVVKFLIEHSVDFSRPTGVNNTAVQLAATNGHLQTVQTLKEAGGILDGISLHHAAARGHNHVVQYLLREGIEDSCVHNIPVSSNLEDIKFKAAKVHLNDNRHVYLRETALHAAVRGGHRTVIKSLLNEDRSAVNCTNSAGRLPLHEAVHANDYNTLEALLVSGASASVPCNTVITPSAQVPNNVAKNLCPCGFSPLHIAAMYGYYSTAELLIKYGANVSAGDCSSATPLHIASCHSAVSLVSLLVKNGADIDAGSLNGSTPLHSAAACFAKAVFRPLFDLGCDHYTTDNEGMTALHYVVKDVDFIGSEFLQDLYAKQPKNWIKDGKDVSQQATMGKMNKEYPWLEALIELVVCSSTKKIKHDTMFASMIDNKYKSIWSKLAHETKISDILLGISRQFDTIELFWLLTPYGFTYDFTINAVLDRHIGTHDLMKSLKYVKRLLMKTFVAIFPASTECTSLLNWVMYDLVYTMNTALQMGLDVNCRDESGLTPLLVYLRTGGRHMSKVLVKHNVDVEITCGEVFNNSVFHLASYHKLHYLHYLSEFLQGSGNWQRYLQTEDALFDYFIDRYEDKIYKKNVETVKTGDGPLTLAILTHPKGAKVIDECFDAEGYNALHRAAQGANLIAIQKYLSLGANPFIKTSDGFSPLWLSVLYAVKYRLTLNLDLDIPSVLTALEVELASLSASALLSRVLQNDTTMNISCDGRLTNLTLYHIAASKGMWQFVERLLSEKRLIGIDVNCPNKDGITPMYLAKFFGGDSCGWDSPWCKVVDVIRRYGGNLHYPTLESEYFLVHTFHKVRFPKKLYVHLTEEEMAVLQDSGLYDCQNYTTEAAVDLRRAHDDFERVHSHYKDKREKCATLKEDCPTENLGLADVDYVLLLLDKQWSITSFFEIRNCLADFLDNELDQAREYVLSTIKSYSEVFSEDFRNKSQHQMSKIKQKAKDDPLLIGVNTCYFKTGMKKGLHEAYLTYKQLLDFVFEGLNEVKSVISKTLPRYLAKMNTTLYNFETALKCDWKAVSFKYVQLEFYLRNLQLVWTYEASLELSTSEFRSRRIKAVLQPSKELLNLMLRLASKQPIDPFRYLESLMFRKPPLWENKDKKLFQ